VLISIKGDIVSTCDKHKRGHCLFVVRWSCDKHKRGHRFQVISIKGDIIVMVEAPHQLLDYSTAALVLIFLGGHYQLEGVLIISLIIKIYVGKSLGC